MRSSLIAVLMMTTSAMGLAGCSESAGNRTFREDPFGFSDVRQLAMPIASMTPATAGGTTVQLRRGSPRIARLYLDALTRFDAIYGDGIGPAKRKPNYLGCKSALHSVAARIGSVPLHGDDADLMSLWERLKTCRLLAQRWAGPAEMATFGNDLNAMIDGAMLVLSYAATASGSWRGPEFYNEISGVDPDLIPRN